MFKYLLGYLLLFFKFDLGQFNNPVSMSLGAESSGRPGEVIDVYVDALMDDQWKDLFNLQDCRGSNSN